MTATQTQIRRDGATALDSATPALAELAYDTTNKRLRVGDGTTAGATTLPNRADIQNNSFVSATTSGTNTYTATVTGFAYNSFASVKVKIGTTNTGASTLNINSLGAKNIYKNNSGSIGAISAGDLLAGYIYELIYDGTQFIIMGGTGGGGGITITQNDFTSSGTWNKPAGLLYSVVEVVGGGGGSGGAANNSFIGSTGGSAGGYARKLIAASSLGSSETVTIGTAGGGGSGVTAGSSGGTTSFGAHCSATGGGGGGANQTAANSTGTPGVGSGGDINVSGQAGNFGSYSQEGTAIVGGGGSGGSSYFGSGGRGIPYATSSTGETPSANCGAGGGGSASNKTTSRAGASGSAGRVIVTNYIG